MRKPLLTEEQPPTCLHILGQGLVNQLFTEGRAAREAHALTVRALGNTADKLEKAQRQLKAIARELEYAFGGEQQMPTLELKVYRLATEGGTQ